MRAWKVLIFALICHICKYIVFSAISEAVDASDSGELRSRTLIVDDDWGYGDDDDDDGYDDGFYDDVDDDYDSTLNLDLEGHKAPRTIETAPGPKVKPLGHDEARRKGCVMEPPFLYFTFHSAGKVVKYTRDGCYLDDQILRGPVLGKGTMLEFRQMAVGPHKRLTNALYLAQAHPNNPAIIVFGECANEQDVEEDAMKRKLAQDSQSNEMSNEKRGLGARHRAKKAREPWIRFLDNGPLQVGQREMIDIVTGHRVRKQLRKQFPGNYKYNNKGAKHNFGLAIEFDPYPSDLTAPSTFEGPLYASFQHTDLVQRFSGPDLAPSPLPPALTTGPTKWMPYYPGTFHQFGSVGKHAGGVTMKVMNEEQGVRGVVVVGTKIWIANENLEGVLVVDKASGVVEEVIHVVNAIAMFYYRKITQDQMSKYISIGGDLKGNDLVYISSKGRKKKGVPGTVLALHADTLQVVRTFTAPGMIHPAGLQAFNEVLYVVEQVQSMVHTFSTVTGEYLGPIIKAEDMPYERPEQVMLTPC